ncbi:HNH endonuclease [Kribbella sp. VKM Ac-2527]|uniref:HNH endonuclease n=1 Tax=Kribbella caucasensis TaxID=2512215 RepID=A0A4R6K6G9_9ACTN|nr:HNH endonuclease [Kribbella sp. VKM Ac-2527]
MWSMSGSDMLSALDTLQADLNRMNTYRLELLAALDANGHATEIGARNTVQLIAIRHRLDPTTVRHDLKTAKALTKYEAVNTALHTDPTTNANADDDAGRGADSDSGLGTDAGASTGTDADPGGTDAGTGSDAGTDAGTGADSGADGDVGAAAAAPGGGVEDGGEGGPLVLHPGQAEAIIDALERVPAAANVPVENLRVAEEQMVRAAQLLSPGELRKMGKQVRDRLDTDGAEPAEKRAHAKETLWLKRRDDGIQFGGFLAADNAELLQTVIFAGAKPHKTPDGQPDPRPRGKRHADGLVTALTVAAGTGTAAPGHGGIKPHITVTINLADLLAGTGTGDLAHGGTLSAAAIRRLACDAGIIPLVLGANSEPLDVGTEERFVNRAMRRALNTRDKGCIVCGAPPAMCEAHHLVHWANGGPTRVENLVLLCKAHHIDVHHGHWTITMLNGRPVLSRPGWATPTNPPPDPRSTNPPPGTGTPGTPGTGTGVEPPGTRPAPGSRPAPASSPATGGAPAPGSSPAPGSRPAPASSPASGGAPAPGSSPAPGSRPAPASSPATGGAPAPGSSPAPGSRPAPASSPASGGAPASGSSPAPGSRPAPASSTASGGPPPSDSNPAHGSGPGIDPAQRADRVGEPSDPVPNPPGQVPHALGELSRPLGNSIADQLRRNLADYPDPWADDPTQSITPHADSPPATAGAD